MTAANEHEFTPEQSEKLRAHAREQIKVHTDACISLAKALFEIYYGTIKGTEKKLVEAWGFDDFDHFIEKELLWHGSTARSYVRVYDELCVKRRFDEGTLPPSITALRELAKISGKLTDQRELHRWIKRAHEMTACEFMHEVETELFGRTRRMKQLGFNMSFGAAKRCMARIREARDSMGLDTYGEVLDRIINEWAYGKRTVSESRALRKTG